MTTAALDHERLADVAAFISPFMSRKDGHIIKASSMMRKAFRPYLLLKRRILKGKKSASEGHLFRIEMTHPEDRKYFKYLKYRLDRKYFKYREYWLDRKYFKYRDALVVLQSMKKTTGYGDHRLGIFEWAMALGSYMFPRRPPRPPWIDLQTAEEQETVRRIDLQTVEEQETVRRVVRKLPNPPKGAATE